MKAKTVAVIEDDEAIRSAMIKVLEMEGFKVLSAKNGREGLDLLERESADLILLDLTMPVMDGYEFLEAKASLKEVSQIPVIVLSAVSKEKLEGLGVDAIVRKPFSIGALLDEVEKYV